MSDTCYNLGRHVRHWLHYITPTWRVAGLSRRVLQHGILATFLVYNEESRNQVDNGQIVMAMVYDVPNLVNNGRLSKGLRALKAKA